MSHPHFRNHPLEGDGCRTTFFQYIIRQSGVNAAANVRIPDTVVFEHGYPRWSYHYDARGGEVRRGAGGTDLHASSILDFYLSRHIRAKRMDIIAIYTFTFDDPISEETRVGVEYLDREGLERFLMKGDIAKKQHGILQQYVQPLEEHYTVVRAQWTPTFCVIRRRTNKRAITDFRASLSERFVTFDGPDYRSTEVNCSRSSSAKIEALCGTIGDHLSRTQHLKISNMLLFFIVDSRSHVNLLWCGSLYFSNPHATSTPAIPPTIMRGPVFAESREEPYNEQELKEAAAKSFQLETQFRPGSNNLNELEDQEPATSDDALAVRSREVTANEEIVNGLYCGEWFRVNPVIQRQYDDLKDREGSAKAIVHDMFYSASSYFESCDKTSLTVEAPYELERCIDSSTIRRMYRASGLKVIDGTRVRVMAPTRQIDDGNIPPLATVIAAAHTFLSKHFAHQENQLRKQCMPALREALVAACLRDAISK